MANAFQIRASINAWLGTVLPLDGGASGDQVAYQATQAQRGTEWRVHWDAERDGHADQAFRRLVQIDRLRSDGDEIALEKNWVAALAAMGLTTPGATAKVTVYDYPAVSLTSIGTARVRRLDGKGWQMLPDPPGRVGQLRSTITLQIDYAA